MTTKGHITKVFREHGIIHTLPKSVIDKNDENKVKSLSVKLYIFRGQYSGMVNDVVIPTWFA